MLTPVGVGRTAIVTKVRRMIQQIQRRLVTAKRVETSVANRVLHLNTIVLTSILFTAIVFELPLWADKELHNLYKQFLWAHAMTTDSSRHKINPGLLVTPKHAGGIGLVDVAVAVKAQRIKHAMLWLNQKEDSFFAAWQTWTFRGEPRTPGVRITPASVQRRTPCRRV